MDVIPREIADITPSWLTSAFQARQPGAQVLAFEMLENIRGASSKIRMRLHLAGAATPLLVIVKGGFEPHSRAMAGMHWSEVRGYRDVVPGAGIEAPRCYFAGIDAAGQGLVILEDLCARDVRFLSLRAPMDFERASLFLSALARLHAKYWNVPAIAPGGSLGDLTVPIEGRFATYIDNLTTPENFGAYIERPRGAAIPVALHDRKRLRNGLFALRDSYAGQPRTVVHGDTHLGNLYLGADDSPGFLDWVVRRAPWQNDIAYFLGANLDPPDRRRWEAALLQHYLSALRGLGVDAPDFDTAWLAYRRDIVWGFFVWFLNSWEFQTEANNTACAARFATAMLDHETYELLGV